MSTPKNVANTTDAKSSAKRGLTFTASQLQQWHWNEGKSMKHIAAQHGVSIPAIGYWFQKLDVKHRSNLQEVLFEPSPTLSYVIGVILGDGCVHWSKARNNSCSVRLNVTDEEFAKSFQKHIKLLGINCAVLHQKSKNPKWADTYLASANSNAFGGFWSEMGREGCAEYALRYPEHFVRGFYEAEGSIKLHRGRLELAITNTDEKLISRVHGAIPTTIKTSLLKFGPYNAGTKARWDICINNQLDIKRFLAWTTPCIKTAPRGQA